MNLPKKPFTGPPCLHCGTLSVLVTGKDLYPDQPEQHAKFFFQCPGECKAWVACHPRSMMAMGSPANGQTRRMRAVLHVEILDPIWQSAATAAEMSKKLDLQLGEARRSVYAYLADQMGMDSDSCHVGKFDADQCEAARNALLGVTMKKVREWEKTKSKQRNRR